MTNPIRNRIINEVLANLDIPDSAYETAKKRYEDLGDWFKRPEAHCYGFDPHIYPQGSFRLGTVIRPLNHGEEYDLDLGCRLRTGVTKATHTQQQVKVLVGNDLEQYRLARQIQEDLEEMHRCWRLIYADTLKFHMDSVPSIPEGMPRKKLITESMVKAGISESLAQAVTEFTGAITDNRHPQYEIIGDNWQLHVLIAFIA
jgi:Cyclic GMP-AMP synthase DncV-like, nucleotidyltransferase domain